MKTQFLYDKLRFSCLIAIVFCFIQQEMTQAQSPTGIEDPGYLIQLQELAKNRPFVYASPRPGARLVSAATTIALRPGMSIDPATLSERYFTVQGSSSGYHQGEVRLADDRQTVIFVPAVAFTAAETVTVTLDNRLRSISGEAIPSFEFSFTISPEPFDQMSSSTLERAIEHEALTLPVGADTLIPASAPVTGAWPHYTLPADLPLINVTTATDGAADGYLFLSNFTLGSVVGPPPYRLIVDNNGEPVFYQKGVAIDFKRQPNGLLTYFSNGDQMFHALDSTYQVVDTYQAGNGYQIDFHEFRLLPNGHALFMIYDEQKVNMDDVVPGGVHAARVTGLVLQELDTADNVVFEWRSWDHIPIIDTIVPITATHIDYVHGNAIEVDHDGNLMISSRHLNEITKINRETGEVIWRFGGKKNQFTFIDDDEAPFALQHNIRRLPNGNITLFDNRYGPPSRGVEYLLDEVNKTATLVWSYQSAPDAHATIVGNVQRFTNGNSLIGWGSTWPTVTEVNANNEKVFEMTLEVPQMSYRVHRHPWQGWPSWPATLVISEEETTSLHYSWNGATDLFYYRIYGGLTATSLEIIDLEQRTGFEESSDITRFLDRYCYFQVMPIGKDGREGVRSNVVFAGQSCTKVYLPYITHN